MASYIILNWNNVLAIWLTVPCTPNRWYILPGVYIFKTSPWHPPPQLADVPGWFIAPAKGPISRFGHILHQMLKIKIFWLQLVTSNISYVFIVTIYLYIDNIYIVTLTLYFVLPTYLVILSKLCELWCSRQFSFLRENLNSEKLKTIRDHSDFILGNDLCSVNSDIMTACIIFSTLPLTSV